MTQFRKPIVPSFPKRRCPCMHPRHPIKAIIVCSFRHPIKGSTALEALRLFAEGQVSQLSLFQPEDALVQQHRKRVFADIGNQTVLTLLPAGRIGTVYIFEEVYLAVAELHESAGPRISMVTASLGPNESIHWVIVDGTRSFAGRGFHMHTCSMGLAATRYPWPYESR